MRFVKLTTLYIAMMLLTACQGKSPTAPNSGADSAAAVGLTRSVIAAHNPVLAADDDNSPSIVAKDDDGGSGSAVASNGSLSVRLSVDHTTIRSGSSATLTWTTTNARTATLNRVSVALRGTKTVKPTITTTYALTASDGSRSATAKVTVNVMAEDDDSVDDGTPPSPTPSTLPTASLKASAGSIQVGQSSTLTWTTGNAVSATLNGGPVALTGSQIVSPSSTTTYTLAATNASGTTISTAVVTVTAAPPPPTATLPTASLKASSSSILSGQSVTLTWTTSNASSATLDGSPVALSGSRIVLPSATTSYVLVATNAAGSSSATADVMVSAAPPPPPPPPATLPIANLMASAGSIQSGQSLTLTWTTSSATSATLDGSSVTLSGSRTVSPTSTQTYTLVATNAAGTDTSTVVVTVTAAPPPPPPPAPMPTATLSASASSIQTGQSSTLTWTTTNAVSATLNGSAVALNGSRVVSPSVTTTYSLVATNAAGTGIATVDVTVTAPPPPPPPAPTFTYTADLAPLFSAQCIGCHNSNYTASPGVNFTSYQTLQPLVASHDTSALLVQATQPGGKMNGYVGPFNGMTSAQVIDMIKVWVLSGAP